LKKKKNSQNISPIKDEQNLNAENNGKKNIDSQGDNSLIKKEKRQFQENNLEMDIDKKEIIFKDMNDNIDVKKAIPVAGEIVEKTESANKDKKNNKNPVVKESSIEIRNKDIKKNSAIN